MDNYLEPTYVQTDFDTSKEWLIELMKNSETFKDYNFEGANITMLLEMISFLIDNSTYFTNKLAKNIYPESAEVYETIHSIAKIRGYEPKGYIAPNLDLNVKVLVDDEDDQLPSVDDQLFIPAWYKIDSGLTNEDGDSIYYLTTKDYTFTISTSGEYEFTLPMKEGDYITIEFTGEDIINNKLLLPDGTYDYDTTPYDENPSIALYVNNDTWTRVQDFTNTYLEDDFDDNIYKLEYDKYERYNIVFSNSNNVPSSSDIIRIIINETNGEDGDVYSNLFQDFTNTNDIPVLEDDSIVIEEQNFIFNLTKDKSVDKKFIEISNPESSYNSSIPETIEQVRDRSRDLIFSQNSNITQSDYNNHLEQHPDITKGNAWGEEDENPENVKSYNKVYLSVIPYEWKDSTIYTDEHTWTREDLDVSDDILAPKLYNSDFSDNVFSHLSSRKTLSAYEILVIPELVYIAFDIGLLVKSSYNFVRVKEEVKEKLEYYFKSDRRNFGEIIDFKVLHNFLLDMSIRGDDNERFSLIRGVNNLIFRDVVTFTTSLSGDIDPTYETLTDSVSGDFVDVTITTTSDTIYEPNEDGQYPQYTVDSYDYDYDNILRPIQLKRTQFPILSINNCTFINEKE